MIRNYKHRGLKQLYERGITKGIHPEHVGKIRRVLLHLDTAHHIRDMDAPGYGLHPLKGDRKGEWAVKISGNWRITFRFEKGECYDVDYVDYH